MKNISVNKILKACYCLSFSKIIMFFLSFHKSPLFLFTKKIMPIISNHFYKEFICHQKKNERIKYILKREEEKRRLVVFSLMNEEIMFEIFSVYLMQTKMFYLSRLYSYKHSILIIKLFFFHFFFLRGKTFAMERSQFDNRTSQKEWYRIKFILLFFFVRRGRVVVQGINFEYHQCMLLLRNIIIMNCCWKEARWKNKKVSNIFAFWLRFCGLFYPFVLFRKTLYAAENHLNLFIIYVTLMWNVMSISVIQKICVPRNTQNKLICIIICLSACEVHFRVRFEKSFPIQFFF